MVSHFSHNPPVVDVRNGLMGLGFDVISVKHMTNKRRSSAKGIVTANLPLFLITLPRKAKSQQMFTSSRHCHFAIIVEAYTVQNILTQCYNCQKLSTCEQIGSNLPVSCAVWAITCTRTVQRNGTLDYRRATTASWLKEIGHIPPNTGAAVTRRKLCEKVQGSTQDYKWKGIVLKRSRPSSIIRSGASRKLGARAATTSMSGHSRRSDRS